jgi:hypothetical protein
MKRYHTSSCFPFLLTALLAACAGNAAHKEWEDLDYSPVYRAYEKRENDSSYKPASIVGCIDDDLYNCK